jgi:hypothetical protein
LTELIEPDSESLRLAPEQLAGMFTSLLMVRGRKMDEDGPSTADVIDVLLHGALT